MATKALVTQDEIKYERLRRLMHVFQGVDRVLSGQPVRVAAEDSPFDAPAWNNGLSVVFNRRLIGSVTGVNDLVKLTGLNYHELGHILFTPGSNYSKVTKWAKDTGAKDALDILEDQRQESLMCGLYPDSAEAYLTAAFMEFALSNQGEWPRLSWLAHGRRHLPVEVRDELRKRFENQAIWQEGADLIDEFRLLDFPRDDGTRAIEIVRRFNELLSQLSEKMKDPYGHGQRPEENGSNFGGASKKMAAEAAEGRDEQDEDREEEESEGGDADGDGDGQGQGQGDGDSDQEGDGDGDSQSSRAGNGKDPGKPSKNFKDDLKQMYAEIVDDEQVQTDLKNNQAALVHGAGFDTLSHLDKKKGRRTAVPQEWVSSVRGVSRELQRIRVDMDPGWSRRLPSGKLNVTRAMQGGDLDELFDQWEPGHNDSTDIEMVVLVDLSDSMEGVMQHVSLVLWAIKRSVEQVGGKVTVIGFGNTARTMMQKNEKSEGAYYTHFDSYREGTQPLQALEEAARLFHFSKTHKKILFTITDGEWHNPLKADEWVQRIGDSGVMTVNSYIETGGGNPSNPHKAKVHYPTDNPAALVELARRVVRNMIRGR